MIAGAIANVDADRLRRDLFYLSKDPLPYRKVNYTLPGHTKSTLDEAGDYICAQLEQAGWTVTCTPQRVQAYRCDSSKPIHHWYSKPAPNDPWYTTCNIEAEWRGTERPDEIIQLISHKDSMSWIDSPGAHDNAVGTVANLEIARVLGNMPCRRTVRILFCNEEHSPWTSKAAAEAAAQRSDNIIAVFNQDSLDGKSPEDMQAGRLTHVSCYSTPEGKVLAERMHAANATYGVGLDATVVHKKNVNDDDGMFIKAGFTTTVMNLGSFPYLDDEYHLPGDVPERVNIDNLRRSTQLVIATVLELDTDV